MPCQIMLVGTLNLCAPVSETSLRNSRASPRWLTVCASLLTVAACGKPAFVDEACTRDTGTRVYVQESAGDLAMPFKFDVKFNMSDSHRE